ncbi:hypothetical protein RUND412_004536 [Rhizina undulata]
MATIIGAFFAIFTDFIVNPDASYRDEFERLAVEKGWKAPPKKKKRRKKKNPSQLSQAPDASYLPQTTQTTLTVTLLGVDGHIKTSAAAKAKKEHNRARREYRIAVTEEFNHQFQPRPQRHDDTEYETDDETGDKKEGRATLKDWQNLCVQLGVASPDVPGDIEECKRVVEGKYVNMDDLLQAKIKGVPVRLSKPKRNYGVIPKGPIDPFHWIMHILIPIGEYKRRKHAQLAAATSQLVELSVGVPPE